MYFDLGTSLTAILIALIIAGLVFNDADKLRLRGVKLSPLLWAILTFLALALALPAYLFLRFTIWRTQVSDVGLRDYEAWREV